MSGQDDSASRYVQYGCGFCAPPGWRNFDASPTLRFERLPIVGRLYTRNAQRFPDNVEYGDIVRGLPLPRGQARVVYASHVLEHLALEDLRAALRNTLELLEPGGTFRLVVPDLRAYAKRYLESSDPKAAIELMQSTALGRESRPRTLAQYARSALGNSAHMWMWDHASLEGELQSAGFIEIRRCSYGDWSEAVIADVEQADRLCDAVAIEARRPGGAAHGAH